MGEGEKVVVGEEGGGEAASKQMEQIGGGQRNRPQHLVWQKRSKDCGLSY